MRADETVVSISGVSAGMSGLAAAQSMFGATAQAAAGISAPASGSSDGATAEAAQVAVLRQALDIERSMVNILA